MKEVIGGFGNVGVVNEMGHRFMKQRIERSGSALKVGDVNRVLWGGKEDF